MSEITVHGITLYIDTDKEGYKSISSDGFKTNGPAGDSFRYLLNTLRSAQSEDDREHDGVAHSRCCGTLRCRHVWNR